MHNTAQQWFISDGCVGFVDQAIPNRIQTNHRGLNIFHVYDTFSRLTRGFDRQFVGALTNVLIANYKSRLCVFTLYSSNLNRAMTPSARSNATKVPGSLIHLNPAKVADI